MPRKGNRTKSITVSGKRIPLELEIAARKLQADMLRQGKKISLQDSYRRIARMFSNRR